MRKYIYFTILLLGFSATGCSGQKTESEPKSEVADSQIESFIGDISLEEARKLIRERSDLIIIDFRTPEEIAEGKIDGAMEIDFYSDSLNIAISRLDKNKEYLVYCRSGNRSGQAMNMMKEAGFISVKNMEGGFNAWKEN